MGIEAFVHDGHQFTYFGLFPSLIRMPVLLITSKLDGRMTSPSILLAWATTALFSSLIIWRLRILMRGDAELGRAEAASYGFMMATILGGSVILYLAATPFIYSEDFAWSVPLTIGSLFALLGVLECPSRRRVIASGVLVLFTNLDRTPTGYACVIAALLVAGWFALGRGGVASRRWALPVAAVAIVPFFVSCVVTYAKFGIPIGLPMADQVWATVNAHRRYFLAANGGKAFSFAFLPSTLWAYLQPFGIRISGLFPYVQPPAAPAGWLAGAVMDQSYPTASFPATTPLLFLLGCWGTITAFRPKALGEIRLARIVLIAAAAGAGGVLLWGYISQRYLADLMPFFVIAGAIGIIDIWRRLEGRTPSRRYTALGVIALASVYCVLANLAVAAFPVAQWTTTQAVGFVKAQKALSFDSLKDSTIQGDKLPYWAPAGQLFVTNNCSGLYLSSGNDMKDVPGQQIEHYTWMPVEQSASFTRTIGFTFNRPERYLTGAVTLLTYGVSRLILRPLAPGYVDLALEDSGTSISWPPSTSWTIPIHLLDEQYQTVVTIDPNLHSFTATWYGSKLINHYISGNGPAVVHPTPQPTNGTMPVVTVADVPMRSTTTPLCWALHRSVGAHDLGTS
jgi:hypothetical protein